MIGSKINKACCLALCCLLSTAVFSTDKQTLVITGSDSMAGLITAWSGAFRDTRPDIVMEIQAAGSAAAPTALAQGTASLGAMSRLMNNTELERFVAVKGFLPTAIPVGSDDIAVIVHPSNPVDSLTLLQLDQIYSATRQCGGGGPLNRWRDVSLSTGQSLPKRLAEMPVEAYGRTSLSGSYGRFKDRALCRGDYAPRVIELPGFSAIVDAVARVPSAIGYVSRGAVDHRVKVVDIAALDLLGQPAISTAEQPGYPLSRSLYLYLSVSPDSVPSPLQCAFLGYLQSDEAQAILIEQGFSVAGESSLPADRKYERVLNACGA